VEEESEDEDEVYQPTDVDSASEETEDSEYSEGDTDESDASLDDELGLFVALVLNNVK